MSQEHDTTVQDTMIEQLRESRVNGFPFFAYTGIRDFVMEGENTLMFKNIPANPNEITNVVIAYDFGRDAYRLHVFQKNQRTIPKKSFNEVYFDEMADIIVREMGIN